MNISVVDETLILDSRKIETISTLKPSGVIFDELMLWDSALCGVISKLSNEFGIFYTFRNIFPQRVY